MNKTHKKMVTYYWLNLGNVYFLKIVFYVIHILFQKQKKKIQFLSYLYHLKRENRKDLTDSALLLKSYQFRHCFENGSMAKLQDISYNICYCFLPIARTVLHLVKNKIAMLVFMFYFFISNKSYK